LGEGSEGRERWSQLGDVILSYIIDCGNVVYVVYLELDEKGEAEFIQSLYYVLSSYRRRRVNKMRFQRAPDPTPVPLHRDHHPHSTSSYRQ
jgi:hypothetical protein